MHIVLIQSISTNAPQRIILCQFLSCQGTHNHELSLYTVVRLLIPLVVQLASKSVKVCFYINAMLSLPYIYIYILFESKGDKLSSSAECRIRTQGLIHLFASRLNACWQTDWAIEDQAKNLNIHTYMFVVVNFDALAQASDIRIERRQVVFLCWMQDSNPSGSQHTYIHTCLLLLISMLWHRQAIFKSKGDKLCSSAECRIWNRGPRHQIASRLNVHWQTDWAIEDQAKNLNSTACPYDQRAFSPLDPTVSWLSHLALAIYIFVIVNFDALAQASDIQIKRRHVVFLCWMQDLNPGSQTPNRQQCLESVTRSVLQTAGFPSGHQW